MKTNSNQKQNESAMKKREKNYITQLKKKKKRKL